MDGEAYRNDLPKISWRETVYFVLLIAVAMVVSFVLAQAAQAEPTNPSEHWVNAYARNDGVFVRGHFQTNPNGTQRDNYSAVGNTNPHTGKPGWIPVLY